MEAGADSDKLRLDPSARAPTLSTEDHQILADVRASLFRRTDTRPTVGRYTLGTALGQGSGGMVFAAHDPSLDRNIAIKFLRTPRGTDPVESFERIRREAQALGRLEHPNVVSVFDVGRYDVDRDRGLRSLGADLPATGLFVAMELVEGGTLREWLETPREVRAIVEVFRDCARGLAAAHAAGLIHRDFKPANALITPGGQAKVVDFGLATVNPDSVSEARLDDALDPRLTATGDVLGTPWYMAPEQYVHGRCDARADQYALCFCLHEALFGRIEAENLRELMEKKRSGTLPRDRQVAISARLASALRRGLSPDPNDRFRTMDAWLAATQRGTTRAGVVWLGGAAVLAGIGLTIGLGARAPVAPTPSPPAVASSSGANGQPEALRDGFAQLDAGAFAEAEAACAPFDDEIHPGPVRAAALVCLGESAGQIGQTKLAADRLEAAYWITVEHDDPYLGARAAIGAALHNVRLTHEFVARTWVRHAHAALDRDRADPLALAAELQIVEASLYANAQQSEAAVPLYAAAASTLAEVLGPDHRRTLRADLLAGNALANAGRVAEGLARQDRALAGFRGLHPDGHIDVARALQDRATSLVKLNRHDEALADLESAAALMDHLGASSHPVAGMIHHSLGFVLNQRKAYPRAADHYRLAIENREASLGPHHIKVLKGLGNLGNTLLDQGELDAAEAVLIEAAARYEERGAHPLMREVLRTHIRLHQARGDAQAEQRDRARIVLLDEQLALLDAQHERGANP